MSQIRKWNQWVADHTPKWLTHPPASMGRRGAILCTLGILWMLIGLGIAVSGYTSPRPLALLAFFPHIQAVAWILTGAVAMVYAWKPQGDDAPGFLALYVMVGYRVFAYVVDWGSGHPESMVGTTFWLVVMVMVYTIAGWREQPVLTSKGEDE